MLRSVPMVHFRVQVPNRDAAAATRAIAGEGLLHLVDIAHGRAPYDASPPGTRELYAAFRDLGTRLRVIAERLDVRLAEITGALEAQEITDFAAERDRIAAVIESIEKRVGDLWRRISEARERLSALRENVASAERLRAAGIDIDRLLPMRFAVVRLAVATEEAFNTMAAMLSPAPFAIIPLAAAGEQTLVALATANFARSRMDEAMRVALVQPVSLPKSTEAWQPERLQGELQLAETNEQDLRRELEQEKSNDLEIIAELARKTELGTLLLQAQTYFAAAGRFIVISGWVPREHSERMSERIRSTTQNRAIIETQRAEDLTGVAEGSLHVPILHRNPLVLRPFQKLVDVYGTASYGEVQPTAFFAISFLLMFGLMFGDVGHGLVLFSAGWFLFRYLPRFLDYGILLMEAGTTATLFGFLYGSLFGLRHVIPALWLEPLNELSRFLFVAIALGVIVVSGGLILNVINSWRSGNLKDAIYGPKGVSGALLYWVIIAVLARAFVPARVRVPVVVILALLAAAILLLLLGPLIVRAFERRRPAPAVRTAPWWLAALESSVELIDTLFSFFANTISFVRIAAFAAVHAGAFIAIFALADTISDVHFGGALAIVVHVAGNIIVILLEGLTVSVQVLRLEYYEFFGKFFRGGGETYRPLALSNVSAARSHHA